jgi:hypothetical protein
LPKGNLPPHDKEPYSEYGGRTELVSLAELHSAASPGTATTTPRSLAVSEGQMTGFTATAIHLEPCGFVPNDPQLPVVLYQGAFETLDGELAAAMEVRFRASTVGRLNGAMGSTISAIITPRVTKC